MKLIVKVMRLRRNSKEEAEKYLRREIEEGRLDGPEYCDKSWCEVSKME